MTEPTPQQLIQFVMRNCATLQTAAALLFANSEAREELDEDETKCLHSLMVTARKVEDSLETIDKKLGYERPVGFRKREREKTGFKTGSGSVGGEGIFVEGDDE